VADSHSPNRPRYSGCAADVHILVVESLQVAEHLGGLAMLRSTTASSSGLGWSDIEKRVPSERFTAVDLRLMQDVLCWQECWQNVGRHVRCYAVCCGALCTLLGQRECRVGRSVPFPASAALRAVHQAMP